MRIQNETKGIISYFHIKSGIILYFHIKSVFLLTETRKRLNTFLFLFFVVVVLSYCVLFLFFVVVVLSY